MSRYVAIVERTPEAPQRFLLVDLQGEYPCVTGQVATWDLAKRIAAALNSEPDDIPDTLGYNPDEPF